MPGLARVGDTVIGVGSHGAPDCPHVWIGQYVEGASSVLVNGRPQVRIGDLAIMSCPHCGIAFAQGSSSTVFAEGILVHRLGDLVVSPCGQGTTVSASPNSFNDI